MPQEKTEVDKVIEQIYTEVQKDKQMRNRKSYYELTGYAFGYSLRYVCEILLGGLCLSFIWNGLISSFNLNVSSLSFWQYCLIVFSAKFLTSILIK